MLTTQHRSAWAACLLLSTPLFGQDLLISEGTETLGQDVVIDTARVVDSGAFVLDGGVVLGSHPPAFQQCGTPGVLVEDDASLRMRSGIISHGIEASDRTLIEIDDGILLDQLIVRDSAVAMLRGGILGRVGLQVDDCATATISGGRIERLGGSSRFFTRGPAVFLRDGTVGTLSGSRWNVFVSGGRIERIRYHSGGTIHIVGGTVAGPIMCRTEADLQLSGGDLRGPVLLEDLATCFIAPIDAAYDADGDGVSEESLHLTPEGLLIEAGHPAFMPGADGPTIPGLRLAWPDGTATTFDLTTAPSWSGSIRMIEAPAPIDIETGFVSIDAPSEIPWIRVMGDGAAEMHSGILYHPFDGAGAPSGEALSVQIGEAGRFDLSGGTLHHGVGLDSGHFDFSGGTIEGAVRASGDATVCMSGGTAAGPIVIDDHASIEFTDGEFDQFVVRGDATVRFTGPQTDSPELSLHENATLVADDNADVWVDASDTSFITARQSHVDATLSETASADLFDSSGSLLMLDHSTCRLADFGQSGATLRLRDDAVAHAAGGSVRTVEVEDRAQLTLEETSIESASIDVNADASLTMRGLTGSDVDLFMRDNARCLLEHVEIDGDIVSPGAEHVTLTLASTRISGRVSAAHIRFFSGVVGEFITGTRSLTMTGGIASRVVSNGSAMISGGQILETLRVSQAALLSGTAFRYDSDGDGTTDTPIDLDGPGAALVTADDPRFIGVDGSEVFVTLRADWADGTSTTFRLQVWNGWTGTVTLARVCSCDEDDDGDTDIQDLLDFLDRFLVMDPSADRDGDGTISILDLLVYIDCWLDGC